MAQSQRSFDMVSNAVLVLAAVSTVACGTTLSSGSSAVDVGGHRLDVSVRGTGTPVVILESGQGEGREYWESVQDSLAHLTTVLAYSRSGLGASEYSLRSGALDAVEELRLLVRRLGIAGPFVLVGHSIGGWYVRTFAARHPDEVAGLVLVDATAESVYGQWADRWPEFWASYDKVLDPLLASWPQGGRDEEVFFRGVVGGRGLPEAEPLPSVPMAVITATRPDPSWQGGSPEGIKMWLAQHQALAARAPRAMHLISDRTGHMVQHDEPQLIVEAVRFVVESVRGTAR